MKTRELTEAVKKKKSTPNIKIQKDTKPSPNTLVSMFPLLSMLIKKFAAQGTVKTVPGHAGKRKID